jgi:DNA-binding transcriptional MerR regulator
VKANQTKPLLIGQLAKLAGVKSDTVRFYERSRLLPRPARSAAGYRVYDDAAVERLRFVKKAQKLGFTLDEILRILNLRGRGKATCSCVIAMAEATLSETEGKLKELQTFRDNLESNLMRWRKVSGRGKAVAEFCALIEST